MYVPSGTPNSELRCLVYNETCNKPESACPLRTTCPKDSDGKEHSCFTVWTNSSNQIVVKLQGCFDKSNECLDKHRCFGQRTRANQSLYFCCCSDSWCNANYTYLPPEDGTSTLPSTDTGDLHTRSLLIGAYIMVPTLIFVIAAFLCLKWIHYRKNAPSYRNGHPLINHHGDSDEHESFNKSLIHLDTKVQPRSYELLELKSRGRFGTVWKARVICDNNIISDDSVEKIVAVKKFASNESGSWLNEKQVFTLPQLQHENILPYIGCEEKLTTSPICHPPFPEYWIITEYHELGSLGDYLKTNTLKFDQLLKIAEGIARGLTHLHEELPANKGLKRKPPIAHRDFKPRNVLLRSDLTPRIADFGLSLIFENDQVLKKLGQVGTCRYMAPEVLEGAISFSCDSLKRIDMYACGLVLWEMLSRCIGEDGDIEPQNYLQAFEEEVGQNPSYEDMQEISCQQKKRPIIRKEWLKGQRMKMICDTVEECWDQDAEARPSASCIMERVSNIRRTPDFPMIMSS
ncbi:activin receptor type-2A-like [Brevipalpus obovatus]|uniref:activin receptor type-2A-like n=1 Tax=Brevipalpus obovatus TaxID=246614 RepID=UPI003D9EFDBF